MFRMNVRLEQVLVNLAAYEQAIENAGAEALSRAAFEFITTATSIIPVWSGASHGTFTALADAINIPLVINPLVRSRESLGAARSSADLDLDGPQMSFTYETDLPHLLFNEAQNANNFGFNLRNPGPYRFVERASDAAASALADFDAPNPCRFMTKRVLRARVV